MAHYIKTFFFTFLLIFSFAVFSEAHSPDEDENIRVYREKSPAVVNITSTTVAYDYFLNPVPKHGSGSGAIIDESGLIVTNFHVIQDAAALEVTLSSGSKHKAEIVGMDPSNDLAVIKIETDEELSTIEYGDSSSLEVGRKVLAIGNPFGLDRTLTTGIVSSLGRTMKASNGMLIRGIIQTDAAINPGNSGGPLLGTDGRMVGINTAIFSPVGASVGIGFAVPVDTIKRIVPELINKGHVSRPWVGISGQSVNKRLAKALKLPRPGILVADIIKGGPAEKAGFKRGTKRVRLGNLMLIVGGDLIVEIAGNPVRSMDDLYNIMEGLAVGTVVDFKIIRGRNKIKLKVTLEEMPRQFNYKRPKKKIRRKRLRS